MDTQATNRTLAERSDLAPRARQLLVQQLGECSTALEPLVHSTLDDLEAELFRIAEQSSGGQAQHEALDALKQVKQNRDKFQPRIATLLQYRFADLGLPAALTRGAAHKSRRDDDLSLVDPHEFDETMALDDMTARTELHASNAIFDLCHRYAVLIAAPPLDTEILPPGPRMLANVLSEATADLGLERDHRLLFYRLCDRRLFGAAESFYTRLNDQLKTAGILPDLKSYLPRRRGAARPAPRASEPAKADSVEQTAPTAPTFSGAAAAPAAPMAPVTVFNPPQAPPAATVQELHSLLGARRQALGSAGGVAAGQPDHAAAGAAAAQNAEFASMPELQEALAALQAMPSRQATPQSGNQLTQELLAQLKRSAHGHAVQLPPEQRDASDLIGLLYDQLRTETRTEGVAQQLLSTLQVPLLRVALSDNDFFTVRNHPARRLLNLVLESANLWLDRTDGQFDSALNQRLQQTVERIAHDYNGDIGVIEREAESLDSHMRMLTRRAEIAERRQVEAAQGRDRLRDARATASKAIEKRLRGRKTTPLVRALLENAWTDALTLTLLRTGDRSNDYRDRLHTVDQLLAPTTTRDAAKLTAELNHGLSQVGLQATEADQITRYALELPQQPQAETGATPIPSQTELLIRLKSRHPSDDEEPAAAPAKPPRKLPLAPSEKRALETLQQLPFGSWLEFTVNQQGQKVARKLAWHNPTSGRCLLVNARGAAAPERSLEQVARMMARGQARLLPPQDGGMFDRAWNALVAGLRKFTGNKLVPEPAT